MDVKDIRAARAECEVRIKEMLVELEKSTGVYVHYLDCDRFESVDGGVGTIGNVNVSLGLDES